MSRKKISQQTQDLIQLHQHHIPHQDSNCLVGSKEERSTRQRTAIRKIMSIESRPMSPPEVLSAAQKIVPKLGIATVYRNLKSMVESGELTLVSLPGGRVYYEFSHKAHQHHHHFRCELCERVFDIEGCDNSFRHLLPKGFQLHEHDLTLSGICADCQKI